MNLIKDQSPSGSSIDRLAEGPIFGITEVPVETELTERRAGQPNGAIGHRTVGAESPRREVRPANGKAVTSERDSPAIDARLAGLSREKRALLEPKLGALRQANGTQASSPIGPATHRAKARSSHRASGLPTGAHVAA